LHRVRLVGQVSAPGCQESDRTSGNASLTADRERGIASFLSCEVLGVSSVTAGGHDQSRPSSLNEQGKGVITWFLGRHLYY
jgi:hypothetical protein